MAAINRQLNLVIPLEREDGTTIYVHSTPIRFETFEFYHLVLAKTWSSFVHNSLDPRAAPSVAALMLKETAKTTARDQSLNWWDGLDGVGGDGGLLAEISRLTNVIIPSKDRGWTTMPLTDAIRQSTIDAEEKSEVMNLITFFTVGSSTPPKALRKVMVEGMVSIYGLLTTSLNSTEFATSLLTSNQGGNTGENIPVL